MRFTEIPHLSFPVSRVVLGTAWFGSAIPEAQAFELLDCYAEEGGNLLDTAHMYVKWVPSGEGRSETTLGKWMRRTKPADMRIATKGADRAMSREGIRDQLGESLDRLGLDRVDFYWLHRDDPTVPVGEILGWLNELVDEGLIGAFGCSNWRVPRIREAMDHSGNSDLRGFSASQISWSLAQPEAALMNKASQVFMDEDMMHFHRQTNLPAVAYSSQAGGFFAGNYDPSGPSAGGEPNPNIVRLFGTEANYSRLAAAKEMAKTRGCSANQIALAWLLNQSFPACAIVGANTVERMRDSCRAASIDLTPAEMDLLSLDRAARAKEALPGTKGT